MILSLAFISAADAVHHSRANVWLAECSANDWTLDVQTAGSALKASTEPRPDDRLDRTIGQILVALVPVFSMGVSTDFDSYVEFAQVRTLKIVVDAPAAIGARASNDDPPGASGVDTSCCSSNSNMTITSGGGAGTAEDPNLVDPINHLVSTALAGSAYEHDEIQYNFRMTNVEAAISVTQLEQLPKFLDRKAPVAERYGAVAPVPVRRTEFRGPSHQQSDRLPRNRGEALDPDQVPRQLLGCSGRTSLQNHFRRRVQWLERLIPRNLLGTYHVWKEGGCCRHHPPTDTSHLMSGGPSDLTSRNVLVHSGLTAW